MKRRMLNNLDYTVTYTLASARSMIGMAADELNSNNLQDATLLYRENNDLPERAYRFAGVGQAPEDVGGCETWNGGRGAQRTQLNVRVSRGFQLPGNIERVGAIGEVFNLFNAKNPSNLVASQTSARFMQPNAHAGDFPQGEQRVGQVGFPFTF